MSQFIRIEEHRYIVIEENNFWHFRAMTEEDLFKLISMIFNCIDHFIYLDIGGFSYSIAKNIIKKFKFLKECSNCKRFFPNDLKICPKCKFDIEEFTKKYKKT